MRELCEAHSLYTSRDLSAFIIVLIHITCFDVDSSLMGEADRQGTRLQIGKNRRRDLVSP